MVAALLAAESVAHEVAATPISLVVVATAAFIIPLVARRINLPAVVLEILFGLVVGPAIFGWVEPTELFEFLAEFGLLLLMFLSGFEIDFDRLEKQGTRQIVMGLTMVAVIFTLAWFGIGLFLPTDDGGQRLFITLLLTAAAIGLVIPVLRDTGRITTRVGQVSILIAVLAEVLSLVGIVLFLAIRENGLSFDHLKLPALFLVIGSVLFAIKRAAWWFPDRFERLFDPHDPQELGIRASLALMFVFVGLSIALGIEAILGAFVAGTIFAFVFRYRGGLEEQLSGMAFGFFIPIFFITVGIEFPLGDLSDAAVLGDAIRLILVAIGIKMLAGLFLMLRGFSLRQATSIGVLLAGQLSVIIALADIGLNAGLLSVGQRAGAILLVAVTAVLTPVAFRVLSPPLRAAPVSVE
ncbi:MAG: cation:proton antiporter [Acidimicrobiia bacterium]|nr:cation:proton antiporter [Acidimicrobiia bacterium]